MSRVGAAVHVVTTDGPMGRAGSTVTSVVAVSDSPSSLLICLNTAARSSDALLGNGVFCVNTLGASDARIADVFAGRESLQGEDRFSVGEWERSATGAPVLATSLVSFDCRITDARIMATHHVIVGEVVAVRLGEAGPGLIYRSRSYGEI